MHRGRKGRGIKRSWKRRILIRVITTIKTTITISPFNPDGDTRTETAMKSRKVEKRNNGGRGEMKLDRNLTEHPLKARLLLYLETCKTLANMNTNVGFMNGHVSVFLGGKIRRCGSHGDVGNCHRNLYSCYL
jgi:hypothetical protein